MLVVENLPIYKEKGEVPLDPEFVTPIGLANVAREGRDVTIVAHSFATVRSLHVAERLASEHGIEAEVVDLRSLRPLDVETVAASVVKTGRAVCVEEGWPTYGVTAELAARIQHACFDDLDAPRRAGWHGRGAAALREEPRARRDTQRGPHRRCRLVYARRAMTEIAMPRLSDSMEEGTILKWLKADGDQVSRGEEIAEIETDKATMSYEADADGFLRLVAREGDTLPVGAIIAHLVADPQEAIDAGGPVPAPEAAAPPADEPAAPTPPAVPDEPATVALTGVGVRVKASPLARRLARERGIDIAALAEPARRPRRARRRRGGQRQRRAGARLRSDSCRSASAAAPADGAKGTTEVVELSRIQQLIARRMAEAKATIPEFTVSIEVDAERAFALREELRGAVTPLPSVNDLVIKAVAAALREHPRANGSYRDGTFELHGRVNVGMAVAAEGTLVVPTIFDADAKTLTQIATDARALAAKVREGTIAPPDLAGGTFTVSNLGMFGVSRFTAVINPPQAAILAVGAAVPRAIPQEDGTFAARRIMELTLTADHRILYGADAAAFLVTVRDLLEQPLRMLA